MARDNCKKITIPKCLLINILLYCIKGLTEAGIAVLVLEITFQLSDLLYSDSVITYIYFIGTQYQP